MAEQYCLSFKMSERTVKVFILYPTVWFYINTFFSLDAYRSIVLNHTEEFKDFQNMALKERASAHSNTHWPGIDESYLKYCGLLSKDVRHIVEINVNRSKLKKKKKTLKSFIRQGYTF